jgi:rubrerythrin
MQEVQYMPEIRRRHFLYDFAVSPFVLQLSTLAQQNTGNANTIYPCTITVLQESFKTEMVAYKHYIGYTSKALNEKYLNIAYLFYSFSFSEKVHADNYERVLRTLGHEVKPNQIEIEVLDTNSNLQKAAQKELMKIRTTYPDFIRGLETESCEKAIVILQPVIICDFEND